ncbi:MAG: superoxide dismutase [Anaerolineaceae bacterium]|nr:superoxide dismutase [Anaerolineaceae bacterium]
MSMKKEGWMKTPVALPELPWDKNALAPVISANTLDFHHGKHHKAYVDKTQELIKGTEFEGKSVEEIMIATFDKPDKKVLYNNAAQIWNHNYYWKCLAPAGKVKPSAKLMKHIEKDFGSWDDFRKQLVQAGMTQFGSGWAWLVLENGKLSLLKTPNADDPWTETRKPVLTLDVWEHAYYLDYQNKRQAYLEAVIDQLVNWDYVEAQIEEN